MSCWLYTYDFSFHCSYKILNSDLSSFSIWKSYVKDVLLILFFQGSFLVSCTALWPYIWYSTALMNRQVCSTCYLMFSIWVIAKSYHLTLDIWYFVYGNIFISNELKDYIKTLFCFLFYFIFAYIPLVF